MTQWHGLGPGAGVFQVLNPVPLKIRRGLGLLHVTSYEGGQTSSRCFDSGPQNIFYTIGWSSQPKRLETAGLLYENIQLVQFNRAIRIPEFGPLDFFLCDLVKDCVYRMLYANMQELKHRITAAECIETLTPETSTMHGRLNAVPYHSRSTVLRARSSCVETCENLSEPGTDCTVHNQTAPIRNHPRVRMDVWGPFDGL
ncbi:hypothetical protein AVEN_166266-1 [Araneus ventricosus]|uniref:Uncharacterized protein n=1 Tax=Araneus ventricosus TaxID=182803 RepID=A0A4Y2IRX0_ARAVE|nr:hypothetical protein AVEN_166266-1 [Araneus ventricosus]